MEDGFWVRDDQEKAEALNGFFGSIFTKENLTNIPAIDSLQVDATLDDVLFTVEDIESILSKLDIFKSPDPDGFHSRVLKETCQQISKPLQIIFTRLFEDGDVPASWKEATVVPIFKKGKNVNQKTIGQ